MLLIAFKMTNTFGGFSQKETWRENSLICEVGFLSVGALTSVRLIPGKFNLVHCCSPWLRRPKMGVLKSLNKISWLRSLALTALSSSIEPKTYGGNGSKAPRMLYVGTSCSFTTGHIIRYVFVRGLIDPVPRKSNGSRSGRSQLTSYRTDCATLFITPSLFTSSESITEGKKNTLFILQFSIVFLVTATFYSN